MEAIVAVDFESVNELEAVLLAVELLLVFDVLLLVLLLLVLLLFSVVGEMMVEL